MDIATLFGILAGFALILAAIVLGGAESHYINIPGIMIVFGGTFAPICVTFPLEEVLCACRGGDCRNPQRRAAFRAVAHRDR